MIRGSWIHSCYEFADDYECSVCGSTWTFNDETPADNANRFYCPCCGAKLDGIIEDEYYE